MKPEQRGIAPNTAAMSTKNVRNRMTPGTVSVLKDSMKGVIQATVGGPLINGLEIPKSGKLQPPEHYILFSSSPKKFTAALIIL